MIFALPLYDDNPTAREPVVTYSLIGLCIGAFLWQLGQPERAVLYSYGMIPAELFGFWHPPRAYQGIPAWSKLLTSMFLHGGWFHLIGNMLFLWIFGNNVEDVLGRGRYLLFYLCCGVAAALTQAFSNYGAHVPMVGASGAIAGVLAAYLLLYPHANVRVFVWLVIFFRMVNVPAWILLGLWFAMQLVSGLVRAPGTPGVAFWAHIGGFVSGLILVSLLRPSGVGVLQPPRTRAFGALPPGVRTRPRTSQRGSVPSAGRPHRRASDIWG
jgi:membrane associated rhomboid family serine protease